MPYFPIITTSFIPPTFKLKITLCLFIIPYAILSLNRAFMLAGAITISSFVASYWTYRTFFTTMEQLKDF